MLPSKAPCPLHVALSPIPNTNQYESHTGVNAHISVKSHTHLRPGKRGAVTGDSSFSSISLSSATERVTASPTSTLLLPPTTS